MPARKPPFNLMQVPGLVGWWVAGKMVDQVIWLARRF